MTLLRYVSENPAVLIIFVTALGLLVGSFLNVVIHRLPVMMERAWRAQCQELANEPSAVEPEPYNLVTPRSCCPHCGHAIKPWENIPVLSYLWLKARCSACHTAISVRYPLVELLTALLSGVVAWHYGYSWATAAGLLFTWALIALSVIDLDHQLLPDAITLPLLWVGLLISIAGLYADSAASILGAAAGYLCLWSIYVLFKWATGREGMGHGDFKLLAMLGAWLGWQILPVVILLSSLVGAVVGIALILLRGRDKNIPIPFGPYLAAAGWCALLWGKDIIQAYFGLFGIPT